MRFALCVEYQGNKYKGFQRQNHAVTVQGELEKALSRIADEKIELQCAGRTDSLVSATGQVIHFDTTKDRDERAFLFGTNSYLPDDISIVWAKKVSEDFHARFSAKARRYRYIVQNTYHRSAILRDGVSFYTGEYDIDLMQDASSLLLGEMDFASFKSSEDESRSSYRCMHFINIKREGPFIIFDIQANAFLHHMVRNIVGTLLLIGNKQKDKEWLSSVILAKDRTKAGPTAFAQGLYLVDVIYDDKFNLPKKDFIGPLWLP